MLTMCPAPRAIMPGSAARVSVTSAVTLVAIVVSHSAQIGLGPRAVKRPGALHRAHHVVATLHDHARDGAELGHVGRREELTSVVEEAVVHEVVALDPREREAELVAR